MKKLFFIIVIYASCLTSQAQEFFTLEKTLDGQYYVQTTQYDDNDNFEDQLPYVNLMTPPCDMGYYYYTSHKGNTYTISLVSPDYEVSSKQYSFNLPEGYSIQTCYPTNKLTSDKSLVFFIDCYNATLTAYSTGLYGEDGELIQSFAKGVRYASSYPMLFRNNGSYKLLVWRGTLSGSNMIYKTDIYSFKDNPTHIQSIQHKASLSPYPVPSSTIVNIPYSNNEAKKPLLIFDNSGKLVETMPIGGSSGTAFLNVMRYRQGVYYYKVGEQSGKFIVN